MPPGESGVDDANMTIGKTTRSLAYEVGKGRPPKATRWKKGRSGNPEGRKRQPPREAELIDRLFRRRFAVIEGGKRVSKTGFAIIHAQLLIKESGGHRRAAKTRDRYEAFARAPEGGGGLLLRYVDSEPGHEMEKRPENETSAAATEAPANLGPRASGPPAVDEAEERDS